ncbi:hypothetical protein [Rhizosaccharibacter radicis]|uniref:Uncharacterized protein n=1 Tax=Rhizosaccharibacter radicis TaxID=2782605 RepID=A0ABT1VUI7_9PROT|nr:hypothetical protein [Acetobacteraceae bacterium KSS12]
MGPASNPAPPEHFSQEPAINQKLLELGTPEMRATLDRTNATVIKQYNELLPVIAAGEGAKTGSSKAIIAANAEANRNHVFSAVEDFRRDAGKATNEQELYDAIKKYGINSSMIGGGLGKNVMGGKTLWVRQNALAISAAGGLGIGTAALAPSIVSAVNSSRTASNTSNNNNNNNNGS